MQDMGLKFSHDIPEDIRSIVMEGFEDRAFACSDMHIPIDSKPLLGDDISVEPCPMRFYSGLQEYDK